jgi:hypothetical protein
MPPVRGRRHRGIAAVIMLVLFVWPGTGLSAAAVSYALGGNLKAIGSLSWPEADTYPPPGSRSHFLDGTGEVRFTGLLYLPSQVTFDIQYQAVVTGGDTQQATAEAPVADGAFPGIIAGTAPISDSRRLLNLTWVLRDDADMLAYHRIDRLVIHVERPWGSILLGRQALTWGNGFFFNPMDLFNPFAPLAVDKDYKTGDDMAVVTVLLPRDADLQMLVVPRRNPATGDVTQDESSAAAKLHEFVGPLETDVMLARHYGETVAGGGLRGNLKDAAWRINGTLTFLDQSRTHTMAAAVVANIDYSWVWSGKNWYGAVETYYNGIGGANAAEAAVDPDVIRRIDRGELFTVGRLYAGVIARMEWSPLVNLQVSVLTNLDDGSGLVQPQWTWDVAENVQLLAGALWAFGRDNT